MKSYTHDIIDEINHSSYTFKHDNISTTPCPECGKMMMRMKSKNGESLVCQDRECGHRIRTAQVTNARCPQCHKKMVLRGEKDKRIFTCKCGYKEKLSVFENRKKNTKAGNKKDYLNYKKQQEKEAAKQKAASNPFAALGNLDLKK